jgi:hypothetical protein
MLVTFPAGERLLCSVRGSVPSGWASIPGTLYITDRRLVFDSTARHSFEIPLAQVESVGVVRMFLFHRGLEITTYAGKSKRIYVLKRAAVLGILLDCLASQQELA